MRLSAVMFMLAAAGTVRGEVVVLHDGSRIVGTVERLEGGKLTVITEFAGKLEIPASKIKLIESERKLNVQLNSGDRLLGTTSASPGADQTVVHSGVGPVAVSQDQVAAVWPEGGETPEALAERRRLEGLVGKWSLTLEGGVTQKEGNTDSLDGRAKAELRRKSDIDLLRFYASADYGETDDARTRNEYIAGTWYEHLITERWYWYIRSEFEFDEFEDLDLRATAAGGVGYYWIKKENHELKTSTGAGYRHQSYDDGTTTDDAILDLGLDYRLDIDPYAQFTHSTVYSPSLEDFDEYRLVLDTGLAFPLAKENWKLKLGMKNEYNSHPRPGFDRLDNTYYANILVELKEQ